MNDFDARVIGAGRAGSSLAIALDRAGWSVDGPVGRDFDPATVARGARLLVLAVPDAEIVSVATRIDPGDAVIVHLAGSLGLDPLVLHRGVAAIHPLVAMPDPERGADALRSAAFAVTADGPVAYAVAAEVVAALEGRLFEVADEDRVAYHAAATIAANHLVALMGQVERIAESVGVPLDAYLELAGGSLRDVAAVGPAAALTGPVARGDWATVARHLDALPDDELAAYSTMADAARRLAETRTTTEVTS